MIGGMSDDQNIFDPDDELMNLDLGQELLKLPEQEQAFVLEYFKDTNAAAAVRRMPTKMVDKVQFPAQWGYSILKMPRVQRLARAYAKQKLAALDASVTHILSELAVLAFANISHYVDWDNNSFTVQSTSQIPSELLPAIKKVSQNTSQAGTTITVELHDKLRSLELLGKYHTMFGERRETDVNLTVETDSPREKLLSKLGITPAEDTENESS